LAQALCAQVATAASVSFSMAHASQPRPFLEGAVLKSPTVAVRFKIVGTTEQDEAPDAEGAVSEVVRHIHPEALEPFDYFSSEKSFQSRQGFAHTMDVSAPAGVREDDVDAFLRYVYSGQLPGNEWHQAYSVWCLCDFLQGPQELRRALLNHLGNTLGSREEVECLQRLAGGSKEMRSFCARMRKVVDVTQGELHELLRMTLETCRQTWSPWRSIAPDWVELEEGVQEARESVTALVSLSPGQRVVPAVVELLLNPANYTCPRQTRQFLQLWPPLKIWPARPAPDHGFDLPEQVYDLIQRDMLPEVFSFLWEEVLRHLRAQPVDSDVVQHFHLVLEFFVSLFTRKVACKCSRLVAEDEGGFRAQNSQVDIPVMAYFRGYSVSDTLRSALQDALIIGCSLLEAALIGIADFQRLLDCGRERRDQMAFLSLDEKRLCNVLRKVPGSHRPAVRRHLLTSTMWEATRSHCHASVLNALLQMS